MKRIALASIVILVTSVSGRAEPPVASYIFPAGGQRGTTVNARVGGLFLHKTCSFEMLGAGVHAPKSLTRLPATLWFEGPLLPLPDSQRQEDYPKDMAAPIKIDGGAEVGVRFWQLATSQGATPAMKFVVGDLPEVVDNEIDGEPIPVAVQMPVTVNGRIFPRADVDLWSIQATKGQSITCEVNAARLGSPLEARLEIIDDKGVAIAESEGAGDPRVRFIAPADGTYRVRIHDIGMNGSQAHVYRLTITAWPFVDRVFPLGGKRGTKVEFEIVGQRVPARHGLLLPTDRRPWAWLSPPQSNTFLVDVDDLDEIIEPAAEAKVPGVCNGRITKPGEVDAWKVTLKKGETVEAELRAARLDSPLDGILTVSDVAGKEIARADAPAGDTGDPTLRFTAPADGVYAIGVQNRFRSRGGPDHAYRLRLSRGQAPDFRLKLPATSLNLTRGQKAMLAINIDRLGGFVEPITLAVDGLPKGVTAKWNDIGKGAATTINFEAAADAAIQTARLTIQGTAKLGAETLSRRATFAAPFGQPAPDSVLLAVAMPTPFKVVGVFDMQFAARGSILKRKYQIERGGYDGPLTVSLTDKQARHLQGVHGPTIIVPAGASEFEYTVHLPPWMELGRTTRTCVMAIGVIKDKDGSLHEVSFSSVNQNEQLVAVVEPSVLDMSVERTSWTVAPGKSVQVPFTIARGVGLTGAAVVELIVPPHIQGISAEPVSLSKDQSQGTLTLRCADPMPGPFNMPLTIRATLRDGSRPATAEAKLEIVR